MEREVNIKTVKSMELNFDTEKEKEYEEFIKYIKEPPKLSEFVKKLVVDYKEKITDM